MKAGVLALQGDFREHALMFERVGATPVLIRTPGALSDVDVLAIPGGESTAISRLARLYGLVEPLRERALAGMPILGTCAGLIVMAKRVQGGEPLLQILDVTAVRNAYGRQVDSFETDLDVQGVGPVTGVFIRAPQIEDIGSDVEVLAEHDGRPVVLRQGNLLAAAFHPEMAGDPRLHERLLALAK
jgi:pyridoxal 5'-phosphate synthase pdxT subunit